MDGAQESWPRDCGRFELLSRLGRGGMAEVFLARMQEGPHAGERVALKRVRPERARDAEAHEQLLHEAELARCLHHPHIVGFVEYGELADGGYLALELVEGPDLGRVLAQCRKRRIELPIDISVLIVRQVLEALAHAHHATSSRAAAALDSRRLGKQHYRSPELLAGEVSVAVDLWAAAVLLYELLSLESPFPSGPGEEVESSIRGGRVTPVRMLVPEVSDALALVLDRALAPHPAQRFSSAEQFARALAALSDDRVATPLAVAAVVRGLMGS